ncbi:hypothetical protein [Paracoccus sp. JM45]|uniref:hypothetical protein n=1 Tax=Paracoccus sp. JM45 TaxID=2283626 RepID=UPI000E6C2E0F|nr:hypothetical protein [Paracoccus sp. JM45]RJE79987.1 hypothetical protein DWB67_09810 [Paracoccus sp. JM45]
MRRPHDPHPELTEADRTSQTRFGPRFVPEGHRTPSPYPHRKMVSSAVPPSGDVSPDGKEIWPEPSLSAKIIVWGGMALGVAGITAASAIAARKLVGSDQPPAPRRSGPAPVAPRFAEMDENEREAVRRRVRAQARKDSLRTARLRAQAGQGRDKANFAQDLTRTATELTDGLNGVAQSLVTAFDSFRGVSRQATTIVGDFVAAADQLKAMVNGAPGPKPAPARPATPPVKGEDDRTHRL